MEKRLFEIITDSSSDLPEEYFHEHNLECIKLGFLMEGVSYEGEDGASMEAKAFYAKLRSGAMPSTYQVTAEAAKAHFEKYLAAGKDILVIAFSSGLSGTEGSYRVAAKELKEAYPDRSVAVVDSLCASMGEGLFVDYVVKKADSGATLQDTAAYAEALKPYMCHYFTVDNLFHLKRGGRVSAATAVVGSVLNIKPVLHVDDVGHLVPVSKTMGRKKSVLALMKYMEQLQTLEEGDPVFISHGDCIEDAEYLAELVKERFPGHEIRINYIGPVIGTHSGAGTLALFFKGKHR
ncbi:MAG: DegV family protein [Christensenellaceae bacterium]